jgi:hypothetical protein
MISDRYDVEPMNDEQSAELRQQLAAARRPAEVSGRRGAAMPRAPLTVLRVPLAAFDVDALQRTIAAQPRASSPRPSPAIASSFLHEQPSEDDMLDYLREARSAEYEDDLDAAQAAYKKRSLRRGDKPADRWR